MGQRRRKRGGRKERGGQETGRKDEEEQFYRLYKHGPRIYSASGEVSGSCYLRQKVKREQIHHTERGSKRKRGGPTLVNNQISQ